MSRDSRDEDPLPVRERHTRTSGRHRRPEPSTLPAEAPALVLAVPGAAGAASAEITTEIAAHTGAEYPGVNVRVGHLEGDESALGTVISDLGADQAAETPAAVVVPLMTGPHPRFDAALRQVVEEGDVPASLAEPLGPHPLLAEALHVRLAEAGLARVDRIRLLSVITAADGVVVATPGDEEAVRSAGITAVLLASRLAVPVVPAPLDSTSGMDDVVAGLRESGVSRLALAPYLIGPETDPGEVAAAAERLGAEHAEPLGAHPVIAKLASQRYGAALEAT